MELGELIMKRFLLLLIVSILSIPCFADGGFIGKYRISDSIDKSKYSSEIIEPEQKAIIYFNKGLEGLTIQAGYKGKSSEFVWLVPTPSVPQVKKLEDTSVFHTLYQTTVYKQPS